MGRRGNGEGSITRHKKSGLYMARYWVESPTGPKRKTIYGKKREDVAEKLADALSERNKGIVLDDENITVAEYLDRWLKDCVRGSVRESTSSRDKYLVTNHVKPSIGRLKLKNLNALRLQGLYRERLDSGLSGATVQKVHHVLHKALAQAVKWSLIPRNPADAVKAPIPSPKEMHPLSPEETRSLLVAARGDRLEALYVLAVTSGMRRGELLGLKWSDVDLKNGTVSIRRTLTRTDNGKRLALGEPKTKKSRRTIRLTARATEALKAHRKRQLAEMMKLAGLREDHGLVFTTQSGTLINPSNLRQRSLAPLLKKARLPAIRFHDLRHTCATLLLSKNTHPKFVQELLGHATVAITLDTYSHVVPSMGDRTARAMDDALGEEDMPEKKDAEGE
jgi:integrase